MSINAKGGKKMVLTKGQCTAGTHLCVRNAYRLVMNAELLLNQVEASPSSAYSLWSIAMEEYGKALLLKEAYNQSNGKREELVEIDREKFLEHEFKFKKAKDNLPQLPARIGTEVRVKSNRSTNTITLKTSDGQTISVGAGASGTFQETTNPNVKLGKNTSVNLRFKDFYIDWNTENKQWELPDPTLSIDPIHAIEVLSSDDVQAVYRHFED
jgi:AbiV family abortive infection protein